MSSAEQEFDGDAGGEGDTGEKHSVQAELFKHAVDGLTIETEGH